MTRQSIIDSYQRIKPYIHNTPVLSSSYLNELAGCNMVFKCENFQKMGAFKMRGATNAILNIEKNKRQNGVVTHSSGNFAQAVALAAKTQEIPAYIVMPSNAPNVKKQAVQDYGGQVTICKPTIEERERHCAQIALETGATPLHPSNDLDVILGNSTSSYELLQDYPTLDVILTPVGGGGLLAGTALTVSNFGNDCHCLGAEPANVDDAYRSLASGKIEVNDNINTIADGLRTTLGDVNFPIIQQCVDRIIRVEESEIVHAMKLIWERMKLVVEPSSAVPFAAVLKEPDFFRNKQIGIIISGGNVDLTSLPF